jgi:hypothetical protein
MLAVNFLDCAETLSVICVETSATDSHNQNVAGQAARFRTQQVEL